MGPIAANALFYCLRDPEQNGASSHDVTRLTSFPSVAPTVRPHESTTSTSSGSGLFQPESIPTLAPKPADESTGAFMNTLGSGPDPTSRYRDQSPSA